MKGEGRSRRATQRLLFDGEDEGDDDGLKEMKGWVEGREETKSPSESRSKERRRKSESEVSERERELS